VGTPASALAALTISTGIAAIAFVALLIDGAEILRRERNEARKLEEQARENATLANETAEEFRQNAYAADIYLASRAINEGQIGVARKMLEVHLPAKGDKDLRGYEWYALKQLCHGTETKVFSEHQATVWALAFDPTGKWLASAGRNGTLVVREMPTGNVILSLPRDDAPANVGEIPLLASLASRSPEVTSGILSLDLNPDEMRMRARPSNLGVLNAIAWSSDGKMIATSSWGAYVRLWKMPEGEMVGFLPMMSVSQLAFSGDGTMFGSLEDSDHRHDLRIHRIKDQVPLRTIEDVRSRFSIMQGKLAVVRGKGLRMEISDLESGSMLESWNAGIRVADLAFSQDTRCLNAIDASRQKWIVWEATSGRKLHEQDAPAGVFNDLAISADEKFVGTAGSGQSLYLNGPEDGKSISRMVVHEDEILALAISPDSR
jgi:WD40 repeat protein